MRVVDRGLVSIFRARAIDVWDWPDVDGSDLTATDQQRLKRVSYWISSSIGIAAAAFSVALELSVVVTICISGAGVVSGHYLAGLIIDRQVKARTSSRKTDRF